MSNLTELPALAAEHGWATNSADPDHFGEVRTIAVGDTSTVKMLFDRHGKLVSGYLLDDRRRTYRTTRIGDVKRWLGAA